MSKSKKKIIICASVGVAVVAIAVTLICVGIWGKIKVNGTMLRNTHLQQDYDKLVLSQHSVFVEGEYNRYITFDRNISRLKNRNIWDKIIDTITKRNNVVNVKYSVDEQGLKKQIKKYNRGNKKPHNAKIIKEDRFYTIRSARLGSKIDTKALIKELHKYAEDISIYQFLKKPKVLDKDLLPLVKKLNKPLEWHITYRNGAEIRLNVDAVKLVKGKVKINDEKLRDIMYDALGTYDTIGQKWKFKDHKGRQCEVEGGTWGSTINYEEEVDFVNKSYAAKKSYDNRKPFLLRESPDKFTETMIEVSIKKQHLWMYKGKKKIMHTAVVTGLPKKGRSTPKGVFYITERKPGKYLKGRGYKTWVDYWMRLTDSGVGLHDAPWQPYFGKKRYLTGGSHGCINLPADFAKKIYGKTKYGMTVVIH